MASARRWLTVVAGRPRTRRVLAGVGAALVVLAPSPVAADSAEPTDYRSEVVSVDPPTATIDVSIVGGDSFVMVRADPGVEVLVLGYEDEPYLRIASDGAVYENRRSAATYINVSREGGGAVPDGVSADAEPEWAEVAGSGSGAYAWHDHRAHRMQPGPPTGAARGDRILDDVVPLVVDGGEVDVRIASTWMPAPSRWPVVLGATAGLIVVAGAVLAPTRRAWAAVLVVAGAIAAAVGRVGYDSLPAVTGPRVVWWLLPLLAVAFAIAAWVLGPSPGGFAAVAIAGLQLAGWAFERRSGLTRAVLPTDAPFWLDRAATAGALVVGVVAASVAVTGLLGVVRRPQHPA